MTVKTTDQKGRLTLGNKFANATLIIEETEGGDVVTLKRAEMVPVSESWLHRNKTASRSVLRGLSQARNQQFSNTPPDLDADADWVDALED